jgi:hypothetical protein
VKAALPAKPMSMGGGGHGNGKQTIIKQINSKNGMLEPRVISFIVQFSLFNKTLNTEN